MISACSMCCQQFLPLVSMLNSNWWPTQGIEHIIMQIQLKQCCCCKFTQKSYCTPCSMCVQKKWSFASKHTWLLSQGRGTNRPQENLLKKSVLSLCRVLLNIVTDFAWKVSRFWSIRCSLQCSTQKHFGKLFIINQDVLIVNINQRCSLVVFFLW